MQHERWAIDSLLAVTAERTKGPNHRHSIRGGDVGRIQDFRERRIVLRQNDAVDGGYTNIVTWGVRIGSAFVGPLLAPFDNFSVAGFTDAGTDDELFFRKHKSRKNKDSLRHVFAGGDGLN